MGSAFGYRHLASALAVAADACVLVPDYRLAPEHPFPAALEDVVRAYLWMLDSGVPRSGSCWPATPRAAGWCCRCRPR